jgi:hypothetical protein
MKTVVSLGTISLNPFCYSRIKSTVSPASVAGDVSEPRQTSQIGRVREIVCASKSVSAFRTVKVPVFVCLHSSCNHVTEIGGPHGFRHSR